jgi:hypothetical protein
VQKENKFGNAIKSIVAKFKKPSSNTETKQDNVEIQEQEYQEEIKKESKFGSTLKGIMGKFKKSDLNDEVEEYIEENVIEDEEKNDYLGDDDSMFGNATNKSSTFGNSIENEISMNNEHQNNYANEDDSAFGEPSYTQSPSPIIEETPSSTDMFQVQEDKQPYENELNSMFTEPSYNNDVQTNEVNSDTDFKQPEAESAVHKTTFQTNDAETVQNNIQPVENYIQPVTPAVTPNPTAEHFSNSVFNSTSNNTVQEENPTQNTQDFASTPQTPPMYGIRTDDEPKKVEQSVINNEVSYENIIPIAKEKDIVQSAPQVSGVNKGLEVPMYEIKKDDEPLVQQTIQPQEVSSSVDSGDTKSMSNLSDLKKMLADEREEYSESMFSSSNDSGEPNS